MTTTRRWLITLALMATTTLQAGTVYMSQRGKTYHTDRHCMSLKRAQVVLTADEKEAQAHGLTLCGICKHRHAGKAPAKGAAAWATPEGATR